MSKRKAIAGAVFLGLGVALALWWLVVPSRSDLAGRAISDGGGSVLVEAGGGIGYGPTTTHYYVAFDEELNDHQLLELLPRLQQLGRITRLSLRNTRVSDDGFLKLAGVDRLGAVDVTHSAVTPQGVELFISRSRGTKVINNVGPNCVDPPEQLQRRGGLSQMFFQQVNDLCFSPSGGELAVVCGGTTEVWDTATGNRVDLLQGGSFADFSNDGSTIAIASPMRASICEVDGDPLDVVSLPMQSGSPTRIALSNDGKYVYVSEYSMTYKYDRDPIGLVESTPAVLVGRSFNASANLGRINSLVHPELGTLPCQIKGVDAGIRFGIVSANGDLAAWCSDPALNGLAKPEIYVVDLSNGQLRTTIPLEEGTLLLHGCFDGQATRLAVGGKGVQVFDVATGQVLFSYEDPNGSCGEVALSRDGSKVAAAFRDSVQWWDVAE